MAVVSGTRDQWCGVITLDPALRSFVVAALLAGRRELRRNGTAAPPAFDRLVAVLAAAGGPERPPLPDLAAAAEPLLVGYVGAAGRLGCSPRTVRRLVAAGQLPAVRAGRRRLIAVSDLAEFGRLGPVRDAG